jgi:hypothetical protein
MFNTYKITHKDWIGKVNSFEIKRKNENSIKRYRKEWEKCFGKYDVIIEVEQI